MKKTIVIFGLISGAVSSAMMLLTVPFHDKICFDWRGYVVGYTGIVLSFLLVYFGIRSYRDNVSSGTITFGKAFLLGLGITVISCLFYVVTWEALYFTVMHDFPDKYAAYIIQKAKASGASDAVIAQKAKELQDFKVMYDNPLINAAMTFIEPFPIGLLMTIISAAVLRKKSSAQPVAAAQALS